MVNRDGVRFDGEGEDFWPKRQAVRGRVAGGNSCAIFPHSLMAGLFAPVFAFALLVLVGLSGLALALFNATPALPLLLCLHLGAVMAFFANAP